MNVVTLVFGILLSILGIVAFVATGSVQKTALIPTGFGVLFVIFGLLALKENLRKHAMHGAALFALLGLGGTVPGVIKLFKHLGGATIERLPAVYAQSVMAALCLVFLILCVRSFINARRSRANEA